MLEGVLVARLLLAVVFAVAGATKLMDPSGARHALRQFGVDGWLVGVLAWGLPIAELGVAVGLLANVSARWAGAGALVLLGVFAAAIGLNLVRGKHPDCHCFGLLHSAPVEWSTLVRNGVLAGAAGVIVWQGPGLDAGLWLAGLTPLVWVSAAVVVVAIGLILVEGWLLLNLTSQQGRLLLRLEALEASIGTPASASRAANGSHAGLAIGSQAPDFALPRLTGGSVTLRALLESSRPLLLVFSDPGCGPCKALLPEVARWQREQSSKLNIVLISSGDIEVNREKAREYGLSQVLLQKDREVATIFQYAGTPSAVLIGADGLIASPVVAGADELRGLFTQTVRQSNAVKSMQHPPVVRATV